MPRPRPPYSDDFRRETVELVRSGRSIRSVAESLDVSQQTLRNWLKQTQLDLHERDDGLTSDQPEELRRLRRQVRQLEQERDIPKRAMRPGTAVSAGARSRMAAAFALRTSAS